MGAPKLHIESIELAPGTLLELAARHPQRYPVLLDSAAEGSLSAPLVSSTDSVAV